MTPEKDKQGSLFPALPKPPSPVVAKSNEIIRASWPTKDVLEMRLVAHLASKIEADDIDFFTYTIHFSELFDKDKKIGGRDMKEIKAAMIRLQDRAVEMLDVDTGRYRRYPLFSMFSLDPNSPSVEVRFDADLKPHFLRFKDQIGKFNGFTKYKYLDFMRLQSVYSQRLFEYLMSYKNLPERTVDIADLHDYLNVPKSHREDFKQFRVYVLEKAHHDIISLTSLKYAWSPERGSGRGKPVVAIRFVFTGKRIGESQAEDARMISAKAANKADKLHKARLEAYRCLHKHKWICDSPDNTKYVCGICKRDYWPDYNKFKPVEIREVPTDENPV